MAYKLGVFRHEEQAVTAVRALEDEGFSKHAIRVFAKDRDHSRRVETETDVHADELLELADTRAQFHNGSRAGMIGVSAMGVASGVFPAGGSLFPGAAPTFGSAVFADALSGGGMEEALHSLGIGGSLAGRCSAAIAEGATVVAAEIGDRAAEDGGPDLSPAGAAEAVFRRCGAEQIL